MMYEKKINHIIHWHIDTHIETEWSFRYFRLMKKRDIRYTHCFDWMLSASPCLILSWSVSISFSRSLLYSPKLMIWAHLKLDGKFTDLTKTLSSYMNEITGKTNSIYLWPGFVNLLQPFQINTYNVSISFLLYVNANMQICSKCDESSLNGRDIAACQF